MIEAKSLRIGNLVKLGKEYVTVHQIIYDRRKGYSINHKDYEEAIFEPIPLTEDILVKCGFNKNKIKGVTRFVDSIEDIDPSDKNKYTYWWDKNIPTNNYVYDLPRFTLVQFGKGSDIYWKYQMLSVKVKSLHQLQNIFYCLTNTELNIDL